MEPRQIAWLFPGQGSQAVGMGKDLLEASAAARDVFARADAALADAKPLSRLILEGPEDELTLTANAQPALVTMSAAVLAALRERYPNLPAPRFAAGHSLGEYSALVAAGALSLEDAVRLVRARGLAMQGAAPPGAGAMAAIMGMDSSRLESICREVASEADAEGNAYGVVSCANFNAPGQIVIAGTAAAVARVSTRAGEEKGKAIALKVSAPFHCALMAPAAAVLRGELDKVDVKALAFPVVANVDARPNTEPGRVKELLVRQVDGAVRWEQAVRLMHMEGITHAIEIGPGKVLAGLGRRIAKEMKIFSVGDAASLEGLAEFLTQSYPSSTEPPPRIPPAPDALKGKKDEMFQLTGKVALVTGGSRGIGRACCEALAEHGATVVVNYVKGEAQAKEVADAIIAKGGKAEIAGFDVADTKAAEGAVEEIAKRHGRLDILVANAGISIDGLLLRLKEEDLDRLYQVNVKGSLACAKAATKVMMRARTGRVIFMSSVVGEMGNVGQTAYAASKAAVIGAAKSIAREFASRNITVNVVAPGFIDTDMTSTMTDAMKEMLVKVVPLARTGTAREIAGACVYLASDEAAYVTGQVLRVNGGMYV